MQQDANRGKTADRNLATLRRQIQTSTYQPLPLPKKSQPKPGELLKTEWLGVPMVRDRRVR